MSLGNDSYELAFDHVVIVVSDLEVAIKNFQTLGFQVQHGGRTGPAHNALITFADSTYLELTTLVSRSRSRHLSLLRSFGVLKLLEIVKPSLTNRFLFWFGGSVGMRDWCLRTNDISNLRIKLIKEGLTMSEIQEFIRHRVDGQIVKWKLCAPLNRRLPFFIEDVSAQELRAPVDRSKPHPNGVRGISSFSINAVGHIEPTLRSLGLLEDNQQSQMSVEFSKDSYNQVQAGLELRLIGDGSNPGVLPRALTSNAVLEIV